jgi:hypothetical protein
VDNHPEKSGVGLLCGRACIVQGVCRSPVFACVQDVWVVIGLVLFRVPRVFGACMGVSGVEISLIRV